MYEGGGGMGRRPVKERLTPLTEEEMDAVTVVFHQYETGLREGTIYTKDLLAAMKALGLSPTEQEVVDMQCEVEKRGRIFFPDFCRLCLRKFREFNEEHFRQELFKSICGTEPHPVRFRAKKYKIAEKSFSRADFQHIMSRLPVPVSDQDITDMFNAADVDRDDRISYQEFLIMITPRPPDPSANPANIKLALIGGGAGTTNKSLTEPLIKQNLEAVQESDKELVEEEEEAENDRVKLVDIVDTLITTGV